MKIPKLNKPIKICIIIGIVVALLVGTYAFFADRVNRNYEFKTATFTKDGYEIARSAPVTPYAAGEIIPVTITETNNKSEDISSEIRMSAEWDSPDPSSKLWGNTEAEDNLILMFGTQMISYDLEEDGSISFSLPEHIVEASKDSDNELDLYIPESLTSTGNIHFSFEEITINQTPSGFVQTFEHDELNAVEELDFATRIVWDMSENSDMSVYGYLDTEYEADPGEYALIVEGSGAMQSWANSATPQSAYKDSVVQLTIRNGITTIGDNAFRNFENITSIVIPNSVTTIGSSAFESTGLTGELTIPASVTEIKDRAFAELPNVNAVTFEHTSGTITLPENGGAFLASSYSASNPLRTNVSASIDSVLNYNWAADNRGFKVTVESSTGGTLTTDSPVFINGKTVTITPNADDGYKYGGCEITWSEDGVTKSLNLTEEEFTFTMPASDITIVTSFVSAVPVLAPGNTWYSQGGTTIEKSSITEIEIKDSYTPTDTVTASWDASEAKNGSVMVYVEGTKLTIAGNGSGSIQTNINSESAFSDSDTPFNNVSSITGLEVLDTSSTTNFKKMFANLGYNASSVTISGLNAWTTSSVEDMSWMFNGVAYNGTSIELDLSNWDTSKVTTMYCMFYNFGRSTKTCSLVGLKNWDTSKVTNMSYMFSCAGYDTTDFVLDLSGWDTSSVKDMSWMFNGVGYNGTSIDIDLSNWDTSSVTTMYCMFYNFGRSATTWNLDLSGWKNTSVNNFTYMFSYAGYSAQSFNLDLTGWDAPSASNANMSNMFNYAGYSGTWNVKGIEDLNTSNVTNMSYMFSYAAYTAQSPFSLDLSNWDTSKATNMSYMFNYTGYSSKNFSLDLSNWDTSKVTNMKAMFQQAGLFTTSWDVTGLETWDTSSLLNASWMFNAIGYNATIFELNLSNWDTSKVTDMSSMFINCRNVATIYVSSKWSTASATSSADMFKNCGNLVGGANTAFDSTIIDKTRAQIDEGTSNPGYLTNCISLVYNNVAPNATVDPQLTIKAKVLEDYVSTEYVIVSGDEFVTVDTATGVVTGTTEGIATIKVTITGKNGDKLTAQGTVKVELSKPILAPGNTWYSQGGTTVAKTTFTEIEIMDSYTPTDAVTASWDASAAKDGSVMAYIEGTKLILAGNGSGGIIANPNSSNAFGSSSYKRAFSSVTSFKGLNLLNTASVTNMSGLFVNLGFNNTSDFSLDLSGWDMSSVTNMSNMFNYAGYKSTSFELKGLNNWDISSVTNMSGAFSYTGYSKATNWNIGDISAWDTSSVTDMSLLFSQAGRSATHWYVGDLGKWDTSSVTNMQGLFGSVGYYSTTWNLGNLNNWDTSSVTNMGGLFNSTGFSSPNFSLDLSAWDTSSVTNMASMFYGAGRSSTTFELKGLGNWDTSSVTNMSNMFEMAGYAPTTFELNGLSNWDTSSVTNMYRMFRSAGYNAENFILDLSGWDTSSVTNMASMFEMCRQLKTIYATDKFTTANVTTDTNMFKDCNKLVGGEGTTYSVTDKSYAKIDRVVSANDPGYFTNAISLSYEEVGVGETADPTLVINSSSFSGAGNTITYSISDDTAAYATIDPNTGKITGVAEGTAKVKVTITGKNGQEISTQVTVLIVSPVYKITYNVNNGELPDNVVTEFISSEGATLPVPTLTGYSFKGWYESSDFSGPAVTKVEKGSTGDKVFYAKWVDDIAPQLTADYKAGANHVSADGQILDSWADIAAGTYVSEYSLGNYKPFTLTTGEEVIMEIVAFDADTKTDGSTASITWISRDIVTTHTMNSTSSNSGGWAASGMRTWLQGEFFNTLPSDVKAAIVTVTKSYYDGNARVSKSGEDTLWIPSSREMFGNSSFEKAGPNYTTYFTDADSRVKADSTGNLDEYWLRTSQYDDSYNYYCMNGVGWQNTYSANTTKGVVLGFCTDVSTSGSSSTTTSTIIGNITNSDSLDIFGTVFDYGSGVDSVVITVGDTEYMATIESNGNWSVSVDLIYGKNVITVVATDKAGNISTQSFNVTRADIETDEDGGINAVVPPSEEPETPEEIPEENLPEIIEFTNGTFDVIENFTPGEYETVEYESTYIKPKYPVSYENIIWSKWLITKDAYGNVISTEANEIALSDIEEQYSTYIVYDFETDQYLTMNDVAGDSVEVWAIYEDSDDMLENAVYMAAYLNKADGRNSRHIAKWDGSKYVHVNVDADIAAVNEFTETYTVVETKQVLVSAPSVTTNYVYIPTGTLKAEPGMSWEQWLVSDYNTTGLTDPEIRDINYNVVSHSSLIQKDASYSIVGKPASGDETLAPGLYTTGTNELKTSWADLLANGTLHVNNGVLTANYDDEYMQNSSSSKLTGDLVLPSDGSITSIADHCFHSCFNLTAITIPNSVLSIGDSAFVQCLALTTVDLGNGVNNIGDEAFYKCESIEGIVIPNSVISIGKEAFWRCFAMSGELLIPDSVTSIGNSAFYSCLGLTNVTIGDGVTTIGSHAFSGCTEIANVTIGSGVSSIGSNAFWGCDSLVSATFKNTNGWKAGSTTVTVTSPTSAATLLRSTHVFKEWTRTGVDTTPELTIDTLPESTEESSITVSGTATAPSGIASVVVMVGNTDHTATVGTNGAWSVTVNLNEGDNDIVVTLTDTAGKTATQSASVTYNKPASGEEALAPGLYTTGTNELKTSWADLLANGTLHVNNGVLTANYDDEYMQNSSSSKLTGDLVLPSDGSITSIADHCFHSCFNLTAITIPNSVLSIGDSAFVQCRALTTVDLGNGVNNIGDTAFYNCQSIEGIVIPNSVISIGKEAFYNCYAMSGELLIPDSVTSIGNSAFYSCLGLTNVTIGDGVTTIGSLAFSGCTEIANVTIGSGVSSIGSNAFWGCDSLVSATFKNTNGWKAGSTTVTVTSPTSAATLLRSTHVSKEWTCSAAQPASTLSLKSLPASIATNPLASSETGDDSLVPAKEANVDSTHTGITQNISSMPDMADLSAQAAVEAPQNYILDAWLVASDFGQETVSLEDIEDTLYLIYVDAPDYHLSLTPVYRPMTDAEKLLAFAEEEIGEEESTDDYIVDNRGEHKGYTKYGKHYGLPYGDWCAMFIGYGMDQIELDGMPFNPACPKWIDQAIEEELYYLSSEYIPAPGDIVFMDFNEDDSSDHVGIIKEFDLESGTYQVYEGNHNNAVELVTRTFDSRTTGYMPISEFGEFAEVEVPKASTASNDLTPAPSVPAAPEAAPEAPAEEPAAAEPVIESEAPAESVVEPQEPVSDNIVQPSEPVVEPVEPVAPVPAEPSEGDPVEQITEPLEPSVEAIEGNPPVEENFPSASPEAAAVTACEADIPAPAAASFEDQDTSELIPAADPEEIVHVTPSEVIAESPDPVVAKPQEESEVPSEAETPEPTQIPLDNSEAAETE